MSIFARCGSYAWGRPTVQDPLASQIAQWTAVVHLLVLVLNTTSVACNISAQPAAPDDGVDQSAQDPKTKFLTVALSILALQALLCVTLGAVAWLAVLKQSRWKLISVISTSTAAASTLWLSPWAALRLLGREPQAGLWQDAGASEHLSVVIVSLAHAMCVPVGRRWSWVVPVSSGCAFAAALAGSGAPPCPQTLPVKILSLLLLLPLSLAGAWLREQLPCEPMQAQEVGDEKGAEDEAQVCAVGAELGSSAVEDDTAWPSCTAILPGACDDTVQELTSAPPMTAMELHRATESCQCAEEDGIEELEAHSETKLPDLVAASGPLLRLPEGDCRQQTLESFFVLSSSELDLPPVSATVGTQTEPGATTESDLEELYRSLLMQVPTPKHDLGKRSEFAPLISELKVGVERASACTQTDRDPVDTSDAAVNTSIQWSVAGFTCRDCARPPKLPSPPRRNPCRRQSRRRSQSDSSGSTGSFGSGSTSSSSASGGGDSDAMELKYVGSAFDGDWAIHEDLAHEASSWLSRLHISGGDVVLGDGSTGSIVMRDGRATLLDGVLEMQDGQLLRVGKSGRTAVFNQGEGIISGRLPQRDASGDAEDEHDDIYDDDLESLASFVQLPQNEIPVTPF